MKISRLNLNLLLITVTHLINRLKGDLQIRLEQRELKVKTLEDLLENLTQAYDKQLSQLKAKMAE